MTSIQTISLVPRTLWRRMERMGYGDDQIRGIFFFSLSKFTYTLEMDEEDGIEWSDVGVQTIEHWHVDVQSGDG